jgi:hypothetical protein
MSTRYLPGGEMRPARKASSLTAIWKPTVQKISENLDPSFPDISFSRIHRSVSVVPEEILFYLSPPPPIYRFPVLVGFFPGSPTKTMNRGFAMYIICINGMVFSPIRLLLNYKHVVMSCVILYR